LIFSKTLLFLKRGTAFVEGGRKREDLQAGEEEGRKELKREVARWEGCIDKKRLLLGCSRNRPASLQVIYDEETETWKSPRRNPPFRSFRSERRGGLMQGQDLTCTGPELFDFLRCRDASRNT
jgi:hypothetical protein